MRGNSRQRRALDNDASLIGLAVNRSAQISRINLIWAPLLGLDAEAELMFGERELESGARGDMSRLAMFANYGFGSEREC